MQDISFNLAFLLNFHNEMLNKITSSDNFDDLQKIINLCEKQKRKIIHDKFENKYKELAGDKYKEIEQLLSDIHLYNIDNNLYKDLSNYINFLLFAWVCARFLYI